MQSPCKLSKLWKQASQIEYACSEESRSVPWAAVMCTAGTLIVPSSASIFNEWALKRNTETSIHLQNFFLYFFGLLLNVVGLLTVSLRDQRPVASLFDGQSKVCSPCMLFLAFFLDTMQHIVPLESIVLSVHRLGHVIMLRKIAGEPMTSAKWSGK